jgi:flagellar export protein FliJ
MRTKQRVSRFRKLADWDQRKLDDLSLELSRAVRHLEQTQHVLHQIERDIADSLSASSSMDMTSRLAWVHWTQQLARQRQAQQAIVHTAQQQVDSARLAVEQQYRRVQSWQRLLERLQKKLQREQELLDYKINDERAAIQSARSQ